MPVRPASPAPARGGGAGSRTAGDPFSYRVCVQLVMEPSGRSRSVFNCSGDVAASTRPELVALDREQFVCCHLDVRHRLISREVACVGHVTSALIHRREVFKAAILAHAAAVALVHNRPSGDPEASRGDVEVTRRLLQAGDLLRIPELDHVVVPTAGYTSLADRHLA